MRVPLAVGEKLTLMVQSLPFVGSIGFREVTADFDTGVFRGVAPRLLSVNTCRGERGGRRSDSRGAGGHRCISKGAGKAALALFNSKDIEAMVAFASSPAGDSAQASQESNDLAKRFPHNTLVGFNYLPTIHAAGELRNGDAANAIQTLAG